MDCSPSQQYAVSLLIELPHLSCLLVCGASEDKDDDIGSTGDGDLSLDNGVVELLESALEKGVYDGVGQ